MRRIAVPLSIMTNVYFIAVFGGAALVFAGVEYLRRQAGLVPVLNKSRSTARIATARFVHQHLQADQRSNRWPYDMGAMTVASEGERPSRERIPALSQAKVNDGFNKWRREPCNITNI
jgi:hypothetical protein